MALNLRRYSVQLTSLRWIQLCSRSSANSKRQNSFHRPPKNRQQPPPKSRPKSTTWGVVQDHHNSHLAPTLAQSSPPTNTSSGHRFVFKPPSEERGRPRLEHRGFKPSANFDHRHTDTNTKHRRSQLRLETASKIAQDLTDEDEDLVTSRNEVFLEAAYQRYLRFRLHCRLLDGVYAPPPTVQDALPRSKTGNWFTATLLTEVWIGRLQRISRLMENDGCLPDDTATPAVPSLSELADELCLLPIILCRRHRSVSAVANRALQTELHGVLTGVAMQIDNGEMSLTAIDDPVIVRLCALLYRFSVPPPAMTNEGDEPLFEDEDINRMFDLSVQLIRELNCRLHNSSANIGHPELLVISLFVLQSLANFGDRFVTEPVVRLLMEELESCIAVKLAASEISAVDADANPKVASVIVTVLRRLMHRPIDSNQLTTVLLGFCEQLLDLLITDNPLSDDVSFDAHMCEQCLTSMLKWFDQSSSWTTHDQLRDHLPALYRVADKMLQANQSTAHLRPILENLMLWHRFGNLFSKLKMRPSVSFMTTIERQIDDAIRNSADSFRCRSKDLASCLFLLTIFDYPVKRDLCERIVELVETPAYFDSQRPFPPDSMLEILSLLLMNDIRLSTDCIASVLSSEYLGPWLQHPHLRRLLRFARLSLVHLDIYAGSLPSYNGPRLTPHFYSTCLNSNEASHADLRMPFNNTQQNVSRNSKRQQHCSLIQRLVAEQILNVDQKFFQMVRILPEHEYADLAIAFKNGRPIPIDSRRFARQISDPNQLRCPRGEQWFVFSIQSESQCVRDFDDGNVTDLKYTSPPIGVLTAQRRSLRNLGYSVVSIQLVDLLKCRSDERRLVERIRSKLKPNRL